MNDLQLEAYCDHFMRDEVVTLQGSTPSYFGVLTCRTNKDTAAIQIREFHDTEGLTNYSYVHHGMTNWSLSVTNSQKLDFNSLGIGSSGSASFVDGSSQILPQKLYLASYRTIQDDCPKCYGLNISRDVHLDENGELLVVASSEKVRQSVIKAILTKQGENQFHLTYGSSLQAIVGRKIDNFTLLTLQQSIQNAIFFLQAEQRGLQNLPDDERILRLSDIQVREDESDPRVLKVVIAVTTGNYEEVSLGLNLTVA